jgi:drug/metabolite transporter (DMT)-like permease
MIALSVVLALLAAFGQATASVLQRRGATYDTPQVSATPFSWLIRLIRRPVWIWGAASLGLASLCQAGALATGPLAVVQPVQTTELLFTLIVGSVVFRRRPDARTWWAFIALATGLAVFLRLADPSEGRPTVPDGRWPLTAVVVSTIVLALVAVSARLPSAGRAAVLGTATAIGFSCTAALMKDAIGRLPGGLDAFVMAWQTYATLVVGVASFLMLQVTLRAGTLVASEPALTLGDSFLSTILGATLFDESITLGVRVVPEAVALGVLVVGSVQLVRSPLVSGRKGEEMW